MKNVLGPEKVIGEGLQLSRPSTTWLSSAGWVQIPDKGPEERAHAGAKKQEAGSDSGAGIPEPYFSGVSGAKTKWP